MGAKFDVAKDRGEKLRAKAKATKASVREKWGDAKAKFDDAKEEGQELRAKAKAAKAAWKAGLIEQEDGDDRPNRGKRFGERLKKRGKGFRAKFDGAKDRGE